MSEWREVKLGELIEEGAASLQTGPFGTMLNASEYVTNGVPVIAVQDIGNNKLVHNKFVYVDHETVKRLSRYKVLEDDIIFGRKGAVERRALIKKSEEGWLQGSDCIRLRFSSQINPTFISYQFGSSQYKEWMAQNAVGATMPSLNQSVLKQLPIRYPPLPEQKAIASILSSLDDKIDLLHRQNATLEAMTETLFRQWFVEEAKEEWEEGTLDDILSVKGGTTPSTANPEFWNGEIHWTSPRDITNLNGIYLFDTERKITPQGLAKISSGLLPKGTLLMSSRAPVGALAFAEMPIAINQGYIAVIDDKGYSKEFIYLWLKLNMDYVVSFANGSTFLEISKSTFRSLITVLPPYKLRSEFQNLIAPIFSKIKSNQIQIRTLTTLRDSLLPKLMSGEAKVEIPNT